MRRADMHNVGTILIKHLPVIVISLTAVFFGRLIRFFRNNIGNGGYLYSLHRSKYFQMNVGNIAAAYNRNPHNTPQYVLLISSSTCSTTFVFALEFLTLSIRRS